MDQQDVDVMYDRIKNGANLLESHVFQFDFLNDKFELDSDHSKLPKSLRDVIKDPEKRKKLVIYINPPYAEATNSRTVTGTGENKAGVATNFRIKQELNDLIGSATNEVFALFMMVTYSNLQGCMIAQFSTLKFVNGTNFKRLKEHFLAEYKGGFLVPANTFDNVTGKFPIGFTIWDTNKKKKIDSITTDVFNSNGKSLGVKIFHGRYSKSINKWITQFRSKSDFHTGLLSNYPPDFQNQSKVFITISPTARSGPIKITQDNLLVICTYFAVRHCIAATWLNDRDQFLHPTDNWQLDVEFQNDCLAFTLFSGQNKITVSEGTNHWIPFTEQEVDAREKFESNFMTKFIHGKLKPTSNGDLLGNHEMRDTPLQFSSEAKAVFDAGRELWHYFHRQSGVNVNGALYDIREYFQGRSSSGRMNNTSEDKTYNELIQDLRSKHSLLAEAIQPKVYEYGFLKR